MSTAKDIIVKPISSSVAINIVRILHYSKKVVNNSCLHFGVFIGDKLEGAMQFGPPTMKTNMLSLVSDTPWNGMLELNRMAFSENLPRNSESRAISIAIKLIKRHYPHIQWILSFADATQCGDGTIYRASGFVLTKITENKSLLKMPSGEIVAKITLSKGAYALAHNGRAGTPKEAKALSGFQMRYIYFIHPTARSRLTVPEIPFYAIAEAGAKMYKGKRGVGSSEGAAPDYQSGEGGSSPTSTLQSKESTQ